MTELSEKKNKTKQKREKHMVMKEPLSVGEQAKNSLDHDNEKDDNAYCPRKEHSYNTDLSIPTAK